jgi:hypothetical protein
MIVTDHTASITAWSGTGQLVVDTERDAQGADVKARSSAADMWGW